MLDPDGLLSARCYCSWTIPNPLAWHRKGIRMSFVPQAEMHCRAAVAAAAAAMGKQDASERISFNPWLMRQNSMFKQLGLPANQQQVIAHPPIYIMSTAMCP